MKKAILFILSFISSFLVSATGHRDDTCIKNLQQFIPLAINQKEFKQFDSYFKGKSVVAMGEATHGTHEFFQIKSNVFKYLVQKFGFNVFALEANFNECEKVNQYILTGAGNPKQLVNEFMLWPWKTEEVLEVIEWMRAYNEKHKNKLWFYGFDSGNGIVLGIPALKVYAKELDSAIVKDILLLDTLINQIDTITKRDSVMVLAKTMLANYISQGTKYNSHPNWQAFLHTFQTVIQNLEYYYQDLVYTVRDRHMAENIKWALKQDKHNKIFI